MIGGFLGAGKTTAIARLARTLTEQGKKVGIVTNDQAYDLVDTHSLRAQGFDVGEVPGACFCCKFDDLIDTAAGLVGDAAPDVIITEPVGSCTDLVATVIEPLRQLHGDRYEIGSLAVLLKPGHGLRILRNESGAGFSPKAAYIFLKQLEEADVLVINKIDILSDEDQAELQQLLGERFPDKQILAMSSRTGAGFDSFVEAVNEPSQQASRKMMEVDYEIYAQGEAELGWLNCQVEFQAKEGATFSLDDATLRLVEIIHDRLNNEQVEPAHLKVLAAAGMEVAVANLVESTGPAEVSVASEASCPAASFTVNARVACDPELLERIVETSAAELANEFSLSHKVKGMQRFRPAPPVPTHRVTES